MIVDVWSFTVANGKLAEARDINHRICKYHDSQELVLRCKALHPMNGNTDKLYAVIEFESLATMEQYWKSFWQNGWPKFKDEWDPAFAAQGSAKRYQYHSPE